MKLVSPDTQNLTLPRGLFFDWDNTLVHGGDGIFEALNLTFAAMGMPTITREDFDTRPQVSLNDCFPEIFGEDRWEEARDVYHECFGRIHVDHLVTTKDAPILIETLKRYPGYKAIVSNKEGPYLRQEARHFGWSDVFDEIVGSTDAAHDKPHEATVQLAAGDPKFKGGPEYWFVGDSPVDVKCALNSGCRPVLVGKLHPTLEEENFDIDILYFDCCAHLSKTLDELCQNSKKIAS